MTPRSRTDRFQLDSAGRLVATDAKTVYVLSPLAAEVWRRADGSLPLASLVVAVAAAFPEVTAAEVDGALDELNAVGALATAPPPTEAPLGRRDVLRAMVGAAASVVAMAQLRPSAAHAVETEVCGEVERFGLREMEVKAKDYDPAWGRSRSTQHIEAEEAQKFAEQTTKGSSYRYAEERQKKKIRDADREQNRKSAFLPGMLTTPTPAYLETRDGRVFEGEVSMAAKQDESCDATLLFTVSSFLTGPGRSDETQRVISELAATGAPALLQYGEDADRVVSLTVNDVQWADVSYTKQSGGAYTTHFTLLASVSSAF